MANDPAALVDSLVESARFGAGELVVETGRGTLRYRRVSALAVTLGARMAAAEWVQDALPQTLLTEHQGDLERAEAPRGLSWLHGDEAAFERAAVRDALSFTGGRWYKLFVGAAAVEVG
ncbi:MAG TPA: hypothetical protein VHF22_07435 [Planctomycetota bacterium]|nr:hypothetical protein [Planctomycetota bacterium]